MSSEREFPEESEPQRIGHLAEQALSANRPKTWRQHSLTGTDDVGLDIQFQVVQNKEYKYIFRAQLKGSESPSLDSSGEFFSVGLKVRTLNYYEHITEPILLIFCDLSFDPDDPAHCPLYYVWVHDEIQRHRESNRKLINQKTLTIRVPKANLVTRNLDLSFDLERYLRLHSAVILFDQVIGSKLPDANPQQRAELIQQLTTGIAGRSSALIEVLTTSPTTPWPEAPKDSLAGKLSEVVSQLRRGDTKQAKYLLKTMEPMLSNSNALERAEYWNLMGRTSSADLEEQSASTAYKNAYSESPQSKYLVAWVETDLRLWFLTGHGADPAELEARLTLDSPDEVGLRARIQAAAGRFEEAAQTLSAVARKEALANRAIVEVTKQAWPELLATCNEALAENELPEFKKQLFYVLRARAYFHIAIKGVAFDKDHGIPASGPADLDIEALTNAWQDIKEAVALLQSAFWPQNTDILSDIWAATSMMLGKEEESFPLLKEAATARPSMKGLQAALERIAAHCNDFDLALTANALLPDEPEKIFHRIGLLHHARRHQEVVALLEQEIDKLPQDDELFPVCLGTGILAADKILRTDAALRFKTLLGSRPEWGDHVAIVEFARSTIKDPLRRDEALGKFEQAYRLYSNSKVLAVQLLFALDPSESAQARTTIDVASHLQKTQMLTVEGELRVAQAHATLHQWQQLLELADGALRRFGASIRFATIRALALDKQGYSAEALEVLTALISESSHDPIALNTYLDIALRCGLTEEAISLTEGLLGQESDPKKQFRLLTTLFGLIHRDDPYSNRAELVAWRIGELARQDDEAEEGTFLTAFLFATLSEKVDVPEAHAIEVRKRLDAFTKRFPESKIIKGATLPDQPKIGDLERVINEIVGDQTERRAFQTKMEHRLKLGEVPIPYIWRPRRILDSVPDVIALWEISKHSKKDARQFHLTMALADWAAVPRSEMRGHIPLLDLTALLILKDLNLFDVAFEIFPTIAVSQATLLELQRFAMPVTGTPARQQCLDLVAELKARLPNLRQPSNIDSFSESSPDDKLAADEIVALARKGQYMLFSDDAFFRIYANLPAGCPPCMCTLDLLAAADEAGLLQPSQVAEAIGQLCAWNVGLVITERHLLASIPDSITKMRDIREAVDVLRQSKSTNAIFEGIWNVRKDYIEIQKDVSRMVAHLVDNSENRIETVSALVGLWYGKARLRTDIGNISPVKRLAYMLAFTINLVKSRPVDNSSRRMWQILRDVLLLEYGSEMDEQRERQAIELMAETAAELDQKVANQGGEAHLKDLLIAGLTAGTAEHDRFSNAYKKREKELTAKVN